MRSKEEVLQLLAELEADYEMIAALFQKNMLMTLHIESIRQAILSKDLYRELDELRGFRHAFRYMYQYELDPDKMRLVNARIPRVRALFPAEHQNFIMHLRRLADAVESL
ncbi:MAG: hypothetical protein RBT80_07870 [Candidatus Vecturithrix sp.]|jgi:hypothetical protein|nr:hypothetical protein [Candidatus Vecturithrix sp.]